MICKKYLSLQCKICKTFIYLDMNCRFKELLTERRMSASDLARNLNVDVSATLSVVYRGVSTLSSAVRYAAALRVPLWEMFYDCGVSALGQELPEWSEPCQKPLRIDELMQERGMTQVALAEKVGMASSHLPKIFRQYSVQIGKLDPFIEAFGLQGKEYLLFVSEEEYQREVERRGGTKQSSSLNQEQAVSEAVRVAAESNGKVQQMVVTLSDGRRLRITVEELDKAEDEKPTADDLYEEELLLMA